MWFLNSTELQSLHHKLSDVFETVIHSNRSRVLSPQSAPNSQLTFLLLAPSYRKFEGWNFNFGNTPLDWIKELLE